ncbi:MAG: hypothetical protein IAE78_23505 [Myxococcus sp.]|nr:hypothetical protein [Myxococcus sp.]
MVLSLLILVSLSAPPPAEKPIKPLPSLAKEPKVDGVLKDLAPALEIKVPRPGKDGTELVAKAAFYKDTLYLSVQPKDDAFNEHDQLEVTLYFPDSGTTSRGFTYRYGKDGLRPPSEESGAPPFTQAMLKAAVKDSDKGPTFELAFPARSLPRFQAFKQLALSICFEYQDVDVAGQEPVKTLTCPTGEMVGGPTRLPDELRKNVKLTPTADVEGIEARPTGWVGYSKLHYPTWVSGDADFTPESLGELIAFDNAIDPESVALPIPRKLVLGDNRPLFTMLTGKNPYSKDTCNPSNELRLAMYVVKGPVASRVLEWPAATCGLGRAMRFELEAESGQLLIGYTNGQTARFVWSSDHFERSELGAR